MKENTIKDVYAKRTFYKDFDKILKEGSEEAFGIALFLLVAYLNDLHTKKKLFHGDIKPMNIFYKLDSLRITSDSGTLVPLYEDKEDHLYEVRSYTNGFASPEFIQ